MFYYNNPAALLTDFAHLPGGNQLAAQMGEDLIIGLANGDPEAYANALVIVASFMAPKITPVKQPQNRSLGLKKGSQLKNFSNKFKNAPYNEQWLE